jgi:oligopeptide/dipeptide ABC transporter ATP-binding protein
VDVVSFDLNEGEALGLVGESGSGKTTIGRLIVRLEQLTGGRIDYLGRDISAVRGRESLAYCRDVQMIFQNTQSSFNARRKIEATLADPLEIHNLGRGPARRDAIAEMLEHVGLSAELLGRYPQQLSSGQRQRLGIARALLVRPRVVVADEPVSALDVSVQAQVLNLFARLRRELALTMLFISHDLRAVSFLCDRIAVLYLGELVEIGPREEVLERPSHPYTRALIAAIPSVRPGAGFERDVIRGELAHPSGAPGGCPFVGRCALWTEVGRPDLCVHERPAMRPVGNGASAACHFVGEQPPPVTGCFPAAKGGSDELTMQEGSVS